MEKRQNSPSINTVLQSKELGPNRVHSPPRAHSPPIAQSPLRIHSPSRVVSPLRISSPLRVRVDLYSTSGKFKLCYYIYYIFIMIMLF